MIKILSAAIPLTTLFVLSSSLVGQQVWTDEELEVQMKDFKENLTNSTLHTVARLLKHEDQATLAICNRIHGNYAEYLLRIEKLLDQLTDDRWQKREQAEATLIEVGARADKLILQRAKSAETVEERVRAARALEIIKENGTEKEKIEESYILGLARTALYMKTSPKLTKALVSGLQSTEPQIVRLCIRALGRHGGDTVAGTLLELLESDGTTFGGTIRAALATMPGTKGRDFTVDQILAGKVGETQAVLLIRILREREDGAESLARLAKAPGDTPMFAVIRAAAELTVPAADAATSQLVQVSLADQTKIQGQLLGYVGDCLRLSKPVIIKGEEKETIDIDELRFPLNRCDGIQIVGATATKTIDGCRMFTVQGTLATGDLLSIDAKNVTFDSKTFGKMVVKRSDVQGLAVDPRLDRLIGASAKHDKVRFRDNKLQPVRILALDDKGLSFEGEDGKGAVTPITQVAGLLFQRPLTTNDDSRTFTRAVLKNGDKVLGHVAALTNSHVAMVAPGIGTTVVPMADIVKLDFDMGGGAMWGFTLVADYSDNRIIEFDDQGREVFTIEEIFGVWDVECLDNGNLLITEFSVNRVSEVTRENKTVWQFDDLKNPYDADRLPNGNTLIADTFGRRVIEVDKAGKIVWKYDKEIHPYDVDRLPNGNTLIADTNQDRVIEVDQKGKIVWELKNVPNVHDADRLPNGNTLLTIRMLNEVREVDPLGKVVFTLKKLMSPSDADRLPNGNTLVAENGCIREFDRHGNEVWKKDVTWAVEVNRY